MSRKPTPNEPARDDFGALLSASDPDGIVRDLRPRELRPVSAASELEKNAIDKHGRLRWRRLLVGLRTQSSRRSA